MFQEIMPNADNDFEGFKLTCFFSLCSCAFRASPVLTIMLFINSVNTMPYSLHITCTKLGTLRI